MICIICGTENENSLKVCRKCGSNLAVKIDDEPFIPRLDAERVCLPQPGSMPMPSQQVYSQNNMNTQQTVNNPYMNAPPPIYNYNQPPQIVGYDPNGMPIYAQPPPIYNQYNQPQNSGYPSQSMQGMPDMPVINSPEPMPLEENKDENVDVPDDFWAFFDGGKSSKHREEQSADDFFGKSAHGGAMGDVSVSGIDIDSLRRADKKKNSYMSDTPVVDADRLEKNDLSKFNRMYMQKADSVNSNDLGNGERKKISERDKMGAAKQVDAGRLSVKLKVKPKVSMGSAGHADPDTIETYVPKHKESIMARADHAVEAMPKRSNPYQSELDDIQLPEYMQAKKTKHEEIVEIPSLPKLK